MLEEWNKLQTKSKTTDELKAARQTMWEKLPQEHINKAAALNCLQGCGWQYM